MTALGVLCCFALFVCLTLLASFFLPSHLSFKNMYIWLLIHIVIEICTKLYCYAYLFNLDFDLCVQCIAAVANDVDIINFSYGEASHWTNKGLVDYSGCR